MGSRLAGEVEEAEESLDLLPERLSQWLAFHLLVTMECNGGLGAGPQVAVGFQLQDVDIARLRRDLAATHDLSRADLEAMGNRDGIPDLQLIDVLLFQITTPCSWCC